MTTRAALAPKHYFSAALFEQHNVILVLGTAALSLSFASIWPLAVALVAEALWLLIGPRARGFKAFVDRRDRGAEKARRDTQYAPLLSKLDARVATRFTVLDGFADSLLEMVEERGAPTGELALLAAGLERARQAFLDFGQLHARLARAVVDVPHTELEAELARSAQLFAVERNLEARVALRQEQKAIQRRLQQREQLMQAEHAAGLKLGAIENGLAYLRSRALVAVAPAQLASETEILLGQVGSPAGLEAVLREETPADSRDARYL
jgi:hypothetical protein